jgi:hypothetical protein
MTSTLTLVNRKGNPFPIDMLRYDCCWPKTQNDAAKILLTFSGIASIDTVITVQSDKKRQWTLVRWASFGWTLVT